jgi:hypothetical protein
LILDFHILDVSAEWSVHYFWNNFSFLLSTPYTFLPEGVVQGLWNFACSVKSQKNKIWGNKIRQHKIIHQTDYYYLNNYTDINQTRPNWTIHICLTRFTPLVCPFVRMYVCHVFLCLMGGWMNKRNLTRCNSVCLIIWLDSIKTLNSCLFPHT